MLTHYNKIMHTLSNCAAAIKGIKCIDTIKDIRNIQRMAMLPDNKRDDINNITPQTVHKVHPEDPRVDSTHC